LLQNVINSTGVIRANLLLRIKLLNSLVLNFKKALSLVRGFFPGKRGPMELMTFVSEKGKKGCAGRVEQFRVSLFPSPLRKEGKHCVSERHSRYR
jgi:hypothetical protein